MEKEERPQIFTRIQDAAEEILRRTRDPRRGNEIRIAAPLGLGKPNDLLNCLYEKAVQDPSLPMRFYTALSLDPPISKPGAKNDLERSFLEPFARRQWGENYPRLRYSDDAIQGKLPANVHVHEFYFQAGSALRSPSLQRDYQSINYTHVAEAVLQS